MSRIMFRGILAIGAALVAIGVLVGGTPGLVLDIVGILAVSLAYIAYRRSYNKQQ